MAIAILFICALAIMFESKFTRYRIIRIKSYDQIRYRIQYTFLYVFWTNMEYSISPYSERLLEYETFSEAIAKLKALSRKDKRSIYEIRMKYTNI